MRAKRAYLSGPRLTLFQRNSVYKNFFDNHYICWLKGLPPISIIGIPYDASNFFLWYLGVTEPDKTELNMGEFKVYEWNVSTTIWRNYLESLTINPKDFDSDPKLSQRSAMYNLWKVTPSVFQWLTMRFFSSKSTLNNLYSHWSTTRRA